MEEQKIIKNIPGYTQKNEKVFSSDNQNLNFVGILTLKNSKIFITDTENVTNELIWDKEKVYKRLCSGLVIGIQGEKSMDHGRPVGILVHDFYFPSSSRSIQPLLEDIYVCSRLENKQNIDKICQKFEHKNVYVLSFSVGNRLIEMVNYMLKQPNKFHIMPHIDSDITKKCLPISFKINKNNILSPEIPFIYNNILFMTEWIVEEMIRHTDLKNENEVLTLIAESGMVTPSNRILKTVDMGHQAFMIICDTRNSSSITTVNETKIVMISKNDVLKTNGITTEFIKIK
tara:strand:+ start:121 stop:981 length:861 start_codon:yes stop_codon:yes gene_type:complete